jgi:hypothetical protein
MIRKFVAAALVLLGTFSSVDARPRGVRAIDTSIFTPSQRTMQNVNFLDFTYDYQFIDHVRVGGSGPGLSPLGGTYASPTYYTTLGNPSWSTDPAGAHLDAAGYPQNFTQLNANSVVWGSHLLLPKSSDYGDTVGHGYVIRWTGDCRLTLSPGTWTVQSQTGANYTLNGNGDWQGTNQRIVVTYTGGAQNQQISWRVTQSGQFAGLGNGYCRDFRFLREDDEADFDAGKVFRTGYKDILIAQMPSALRFMNWLGPNNSMVSRFENRAPANAALYGGSYWTLSPPYGQTAGTGNDYTLAAATGTPVSMQHGEVATARLDRSMLNPNGSGYAVSAIALCNPGTTCTPGAQVTTSAAHPFAVNDKVVFRTSFSSGMTQANYLNATITAVADTTHFETNVNTTTFSAFTSGTVVPFVTLDVGGRGAYPVMDTQGSVPIANVGSINFFHANDIRTFYFDKTVFGSRDGSGNLVPGVWMTQTQTSGGSSPHIGPVVSDVPIEVAATLIKELNEMSPTKRIDMYMVMPARALLSMDPDYSGASSYSYNVVNAALAVLNTTTSLTPPRLFFELTPNETWNGPSVTFTQYQLLIQKAYLRNGIAGAITPNNYMSALRFKVARDDIIASMGVHPRVHFVMGGQGAAGLNASLLGGVNDQRVYGNSMYYSDAYVQALPKIAKTGTSNTNTTLNGLGSTSDLRVGMGITKADVPLGTQINSIASATSVIMSAAATGSSTGATSFTPTPITDAWGFAWGSYFDPPTNHTQGTWTGTIIGDQLTVTGTCVPSCGANPSPVLSVGDFIVGAGVSTNPNTLIIARGTGTGGDGTYTVSVSQAVGPTAMTKHQYMAYTTGTRTFTDDSAMFNGTNNTVNGGGNYSGAANTVQAIANLNYMLSTATGDSQSVPLYTGLAGTYSTRLSALGVYSMQYEGGYEINPAVGASYGGHTMTAGDQAFVLAWQASPDWSTTLQAFFTAYRALPMSVMPASLYVMISPQWGYTSLTAATLCGATSCPDTYFGGVEGGSLNQTWTDNGVVNNTLNFLLKRDLDPASNDNDPMWLEKAA